MAVSSINHQKTIQQIIDESSKSTSGRKTGELGKDDFLNLLVTQLRYQDPLKPVDDKEFIGQMAQFSSLEQMQNMNSSFSSVKAFNLIGKHIVASVTDDKNNTKLVEGEVSSVKMEKGKTFVVVKGEDIPVDQITDVTEGINSAAGNIANYTNLIGLDAGGAVYDSSTGDIVGVSGVVREIEKGVYEDYAVMDGVKVTISDINSGSMSADPNFKKTYLEAHVGEAVSVSIVDRSRNVKVPVEAVLRDYNITPDGNITATLDKLSVPVDSISYIKPVQQQT
jgi:flagellar basal-body rod modification protein FlgD